MEWIKNGRISTKICNHCGIQFTNYSDIIIHLGKILRPGNRQYHQRAFALMRHAPFTTMIEALAMAIVEEPAPHGTNMHECSRKCPENANYES